MSIFKSVIGSLSPPPKFRRSFEDPHARDHELPLHQSPPSPRVPPPVTSSVLWSAPRTSLSPPPRVPDDILAIQRRARHLEQQLQALLDAQVDGLLSGLRGEDATSDDLVSNGSVTPTTSSAKSSERGMENDNVNNEHPSKKKKISLNAARNGISRRMRQMASIRAEELDFMDEDLRQLQIIVEKTETWSQKRLRLENKIKAIEGEDAGAKARDLQTEASSLEQEIRRKEEELWSLKRRHRRILDALADTENSIEARLSSYKTSLSLLNREVSSFLDRPPKANHGLSPNTTFLKLPPKRRTLEMAQEYWQDEYTRLAEKCEEIDADRGALDEGAVMWNEVVKKVAEYEMSLQNYMQHTVPNSSSDPARLLDQMENTIDFLKEKLETASSRSWNLLVCAVGAELEAFEQGKDLLMEALGLRQKGKVKAKETLSGQTTPEIEEEMSKSAIRISRSPPKPTPVKQHLFDSEDDDPDPELMISHQDTDED